MKLVLEAHQPFLLSSVIRSHGWYQLAPFQSQEPYDRISYLHQMDSGKVVKFSLADAPGGVQVNSGQDLSPAEELEIIKKIRWMLALEQDFSTFYELARKEPNLAQVEVQAHGRVLRSATLFEDVVKTILTTNTAWSGTIRMAANLVLLYGAPLPDNPKEKAFPGSVQLAGSDEEALRSQARLGYRSPYVLELARRVASGELDLEIYKTSELPTSELRKELMSIKGVGAYAAAAVLLLLGRYDYLPVDSWALTVVSHEWHEGQKIGRSEVEAAFESWGRWKGLAFWFWDWKYTPG